MSRLLNGTLAQQWQQTRFNPAANLTPERLVAALNSWDLGYLREFALIYDKIESLDPLLCGVMPKRRASASSRPWEIVIAAEHKGKRAADLHKEALESFYNEVSVRDALDLDSQGSVGLLVEQMLSSITLRHAVHEITWQPRGVDLTAEFTFANLALFERTVGGLRYVGPYSQLGKELLDPAQWLVTRGGQIGIPMAICWMYKSLSLKDWLAFNERHGIPGIHVTTTAEKGTTSWNEVVDALNQFASEWTTVTGSGTEIKLIEASSSGANTYHPLHEAMERAQARLAMGSDLSTLSRENGTGASVQAADNATLVEADCRLVSETLNLRIDRQVIASLFGEGVRPMAYFKLLPPLEQDDRLEMDKDKHLKEMGVNVEPEALAEKWNVVIRKSDPAQPEAPVATPAVSNAERIARPVTDDERAAMRADLEPLVKPLMNALASALQGEGKELPALNFDQITDDVMKGTAVEAAILGQMGEGVLSGLGLSPDEITELLAQATREPETPPAS